MRLKKKSVDLEKSRNGVVISQGIKTAIVGRRMSREIDSSECPFEEIERSCPKCLELQEIRSRRISTSAGVLFRVIDTAGIRQAENEIEELGIERSLKAIEEAELVILLRDPHNPEQDSKKN